MVTSIDVVGIYPNLNIARSAEEVGREVEETVLRFENVDYELAGRFIASNMTQETVDREGLSSIVPRRKSRMGTRPGSTTTELYSRRVYNEEGEELERESKWRKVTKELSIREKKKLLRKVVEIGILVLMRNHLYQFEGKVRVQREGGSIGLAATGVIARIRMGRWSEKFKDMCRRNLLEMEMYKAYVDDENILWRVMEPGRRWNGRRLEWRSEWYEEDLAKDEQHDIRMMREVVAMANTIEKDIQLTMDVPSINGDKKLPVLD